MENRFNGFSTVSSKPLKRLPAHHALTPGQSRVLMRGASDNSNGYEVSGLRGEFRFRFHRESESECRTVPRTLACHAQ